MAEKIVTAENLNSEMEFYHIIRVNEDGTVTDSPLDTYVEGAVSMYLVDVESYRWEDDFNLPEGWELMKGYSGQQGYSGPVMHSSEFIGGGMARDILAAPGDYVALPVESDCGYKMENCDPETGCNCEPAGWVVMRKLAE
jgi:hypothetical protein